MDQKQLNGADSRDLVEPNVDGDGDDDCHRNNGEINEGCSVALEDEIEECKTSGSISEPKNEGETSAPDDEMFNFQRLSEETKPTEVNDHQRVIVKDDSSDSVVSDSHDGSPARTEPQSVREKMHEFMETQKFHIAILALVILDCVFVIAELVIDIEVLNQESANCNATETDKEGKEVTAANILHYMSLSILSIFMIELMIKIPVFQMEFFRSKLEVFDGIVIVVSFVLDVLSLIYEEEFAVLQLLVLLRLWRIVRVVNGVILSVETQAKKSIEKQKHLKEEVEHELEKFRRYCAAQEKEIEMLRNTLNQHGIQIADDFVAEKPKLTLNQMNVIVEMNSEDKLEKCGNGGGDGEKIARHREKEKKALGEQTVTLSTDKNVNSIQADYHNHDTSPA